MTKDDITLLARVRTSLRVRAAIHASDAEVDAILGRLGRLEGRMPVPNSAGIIFTSCNDRYLRPYASHFLRSALRFSPDQGCHLHLVGPSAGSLSLAEEVRSAGWAARRFSYSFEYPATTADPVQAGRVRYIICTRFARVWQMLVATGSPVIALDADSLVRRPLTELIRHCADVDVGLFMRPKARESWRHVLAAALVAMPTERGQRFMRDCAVALADAALHQPHLATDQLVLYQMWRWHQRHRPELRIAHLQRRHSDWTYGDASLVWHAKGGRKTDTSPFEQLAAGERLETVLGLKPAPDTAPDRHRVVIASVG